MKPQFIPETRILIYKNYLKKQENWSYFCLSLECLLRGVTVDEIISSTSGSIEIERKMCVSFLWSDYNSRWSSWITVGSFAPNFSFLQYNLLKEIEFEQLLFIRERSVLKMSRYETNSSKSKYVDGHISVDWVQINYSIPIAYIYYLNSEKYTICTSYTSFSTRTLA